MTALTKPVTRKTATALSGSFGPDRGKRMVVTLIPGNGDNVPDLLEIRPERTQRPETVALIDVYSWAMKCRVGRTQLEKAREKKAQKAIRREEQRISREARREARALV